MNNELEIGKEIFLKYNGSHFFMSHEGEYEEYKSYNVSKEQELLWINEFQQNLFNEINVGTENNESVVIKISTILTTIRTFRTIVIVPQLIDSLIEASFKFDSFSKMVVAEGILETVKSLKYDRGLNEEIVVNVLSDFALNMLQSVIKNAITVDSTYLNKGYLIDEVKENSIIERCKRSIKE